MGKQAKGEFCMINSAMKNFILLFIVTLIALGCCGEYKLKAASLTAQKNRLLNENAEHQKRIEGMKAYSKMLEDELAKLGVDMDALADKHRAALSNLDSNQQLLDEIRQKQVTEQKRIEVMKNMLSKFKALIDAKKLKVKIRNGSMVIEMPSAILFPSGIADLSEDGQETLRTVANVLATIGDRKFQVAGHTDNAPKKYMKFKNNWELSSARALSVVQFLQENNVPPKFLSAAGYGENQPISDNKTEGGMAQNRRIEITLMPNMGELPDLSSLQNLL
jgi:chemotaxis protein MotB